MKQKKARLCVDFASKEELDKWVSKLRETAIFDSSTEVYKIDILDRTKSGVTPANTFIAKGWDPNRPVERKRNRL